MKYTYNIYRLILFAVGRVLVYKCVGLTSVLVMQRATGGIPAGIEALLVMITSDVPRISTT